MRARFLLGFHQPGALATAGVPLFVSDTRLRPYKTLPRAIAPWGLDSGGFTQLQKHGRWTVGAREYVTRVRRYHDEIGHLEFAAIQDWMCEPIVISGGRAGRMHFAGTGLSVAEHQRRTVASAVQLREIAPDLPWLPVIQGYTADQYRHCIDLYEHAGIDLSAEPLVGIGSVCRRQGMEEAHQIVRAVRDHGVARLHGFGVKTLGLRLFGDLLDSADSMAWSEDARRKKRPLCGSVHPRGAKNCANCLTWAKQWRTHLLARHPPDRPQLRLFDDLDDAA